MSNKVLREVYAYSRVSNTPFTVLVAIADSANDEGIAWNLLQDRCKSCWDGLLVWDNDACPTCGATADRRKRSSLTFKARAADSTVREAIKVLEQAREVEVRKAQRGRKRLNVYRVLCGHLVDLEISYEDVPMKLAEPFSRPPDSGGRQERSGGVDDRQILARIGPESGPHDRQILDPLRERPTSREPSAAAELAASLGDAAAAFLEEELQAIGAGVDLRRMALAAPELAAAWLQVAKIEASNPAGFVRAGLKSGEWPSARGDAFSTGDKTRTWIAEVSWRFSPEDAHVFLDERCSKVAIDQDELRELHELVDAEHERRNAERSEAAA